LTGGGALLRNITDLVELHTGMSARMGIPTEHLAHGYDKEITSPIYATSIGLILNGFKELQKGRQYETNSNYSSNAVPATHSKQTVEMEEGNKWYEKVFKRTKEWFEAEPDGDL
jgi:cell division protein FtsA